VHSARGPAWQRSEERKRARLIGARRRSVAFSGARRRTAPAAAWRRRARGDCGGCCRLVVRAVRHRVHRPARAGPFRRFNVAV